MSNFVGQEIEGYKIIKPIGEGKFSTVYKAENAQGRVIALKKIKIFDMMDPKQRDKCLKEVKLMQPLDHENIIRYLDSFIYNNELIIATEWAEKGDLKRLIKNASQDDTPFQEIKIWEYVKQCSSALQHMHEKRIMHRDLKPANIFIGSDGQLKVGDLGLGRIFSSETIEAYSKVGTPLYMSPEVNQYTSYKNHTIVQLLHGEGYDMKSDVWSLGCISYELCEFKSPFRNDNEKMSLMDLFNNITKGDFKPISTRYSQELRDLISHMIVLDPSRRADSATVYAKATEVLNVLQDKQRTPQIYCILVMEDIYEKLALVDYHSNFCAALKRPPVHKFYFALDDRNLPIAEQETKFYYFAELCYWLMNLPKCSGPNRQNAQVVVKKNLIYRSVEEAAKRLLSDIRVWGIKLPDQMNWVHINMGSGDTVCFILNDLLNRELIRLNFKFENPSFDKTLIDEKIKESEPIEAEQEEVPNEENNDSDEDEASNSNLDYLTQSVILYNKKFNNDIQHEDKIAQIDGTVPIDEWQKECQRVDKELTRYEFQMKINGKETYLKDYEKSHSSVKKIKKLLVETIEYFKSPTVQLYIQELTETLQRISTLEQRLHDTIPPSDLEKLAHNRTLISDLTLQVQKLEVSVTALNQQEQLQNSVQTEVHVDPLESRKKIVSLINNLKDETKQLNVKLGLNIQRINCFQKRQQAQEECLSETEELL